MDDPSRPAPPSFSQRAHALWRRLGRLVDDRAPETAPPTVVVRRRSVIHQGRLRLYYEAILFGDNPFDLERFGPVHSRDDAPVEDLAPHAAERVAGLRYYVLDPEPYPSAEEAAGAWAPLGAALCMPQSR